MGQGKTRAYKHRLDKYYHLARQVGYRSRAAFKLIQLNQQYDFLSNAHICLDLCAAPGGWSQVAAKYMPVGAQIVAIDLAPIKDIPRVITLQGDILLPKTHARVRKIIQGNKADVVLNDGAPNVGAAWVTDSSNQLELCLASVKFATLFLRKGGAFVTKVFRSEHYNSLLWVLGQFFNKVCPTKPKASRDSSAELFVVALDYKAPDVVDQKLLDPTYVFSDLDEITSHHSTAVDLEKRLTSMDYSTCNVCDFLKAPKPLDILTSANALIFDESPLSQAALNHPSTTAEIKELCKDLKVVGFSDRKVLQKWRRKLRDAIVVGAEKVEIEEEVLDEEVDSDEEINAALAELKAKRRKEEKAARRHKAKMRDQLLKRLQRNLGAHSADIADPKLRYGKIETPDVVDGEEMTFEEKVEANIEKYEEEKKNQPKREVEEEFVGPVPRFANHVEIDESKLEDEESRSKDAKIWYSQDIFGDSDDDEEEDESDSGSEYEEDEAEGDEGEEVEGETAETEKSSETKEEASSKAESAAAALRGTTKKEFDVTQMVLAKRAGSAKGKRELIDDSFNRFMHGDDDTAPSWLVEDERIHNRKMLPVTKDDVAEYRAMMKEVNEVETKRVIEARTRKRTKAMQKLKAMQEKVSEIAEKDGLNERSKLRLMERIREKGMKQLKPAPTLVVAQKRDNGRPNIPYHNKNSRIQFVDARSKKELRAKKYAEQRPKGIVKKKKSKYIHRRK